MNQCRTQEQGNAWGNLQEKAWEQVRSIPTEQMANGSMKRWGTGQGCPGAAETATERREGQVLAWCRRHRQPGNGIWKRDSKTQHQTHRFYCWDISPLLRQLICWRHRESPRPFDGLIVTLLKCMFIVTVHLLQLSQRVSAKNNSALESEGTEWWSAAFPRPAAGMLIVNLNIIE